MKNFQTLLTTCLMSSALVFGFAPAMAVSITDVPNNHWAGGAIINSIEQGYLSLRGNKFNPETPISRAEFANAVYKVIDRTVIPSVNKFDDIDSSTPYMHSILSLSQLSVVFGYPDGSFKPESYTKRSEAASVVSNIIKGDYSNPNVLNKYSDKDEVPSWAMLAYINNVINDISVDFPDNELNPEEYLTRAEAAVLTVKLKNAVENYKAVYEKGVKERAEREAALREYEATRRPVATYSSSNTLSTMKNSFENKVGIYDIHKVIEAGNMVPVRAAQKVNAKNVKKDQELVYFAPKDVYSDQGVKLYSEGTKFIANVEGTEKSFWLKKQHKAYILFNRAILNDGSEIPIAGVLYTTYGGRVVPEDKKDTYTIQRDIVRKFSKREEALKLAKKLVPMVKYEEDGKRNMFMLLTADMIIPDNAL